MKRILSFGGGLQTTALAIMVAKGELEVDEVVFADTGAEKPETYWYMEKYIKPIVGLTILPSENGGLKAYCERYRIIPSVIDKWCTRIYKVERLELQANGAKMLVGFSMNEIERSKNPRLIDREFPLIERRMTDKDCQSIISDFGYPLPLKSSCYFCCNQGKREWNWLKIHHKELFEDALMIESLLYERKPEYKERTGLLQGKPLWKYAEGYQIELPVGDFSCWSGHCGH